MQTESAAASPLERLFLEGRTHNTWLDKPVGDAQLRRLYDLARIPPTSANSNPGRIIFVRSPEAKARLMPAVAPMNAEKTAKAPVTAIIASDSQFQEQMTKLFPARPQMKDALGGMPEPARSAFLLQNTSLLAGYFILAARAEGLDCGPMLGFDAAKVDAEFFASDPATPWKSTLLVNLGYGDAAGLFPRNPRLSFEDACRIL